MCDLLISFLSPFCTPPHLVLTSSSPPVVYASYGPISNHVIGYEGLCVADTQLNVLWNAT